MFFLEFLATAVAEILFAFDLLKNLILDSLKFLGIKVFTVLILLCIFLNIFIVNSRKLKICVDEDIWNSNAFTDEKSIANYNNKDLFGLSISSNITVLPGQTLISLLSDIGIGDFQIRQIAYHPVIRNLKIFPSQKIKIIYDCDISYVCPEDRVLIQKPKELPPIYEMKKDCKVIRLSIPKSDDEVITYFASTKNKESEVSVSRIKSKTFYRIISGKVANNFYNDAINHEVPLSIISQAMKQYSYSLDFQRDIHSGDSFSFVFEEIKSIDGELIRYGKLLFSNLTLKGKNHEIYWFDGDYYNGLGEAIRKTILKTPIDGARITSGFGKRTHPLLGYTKKHEGLDFGAPRGTKVYAAGDGVIAFVGRRGGYGNFVTVKHNKSLKTNYAHLDRFSQIKVGSKVQQGQVIGYVGTTGMSTGPHLHFEMVVDNKKVNPRSTCFSSEKKLKGSNYQKFISTRKNIYELLK